MIATVSSRKVAILLLLARLASSLALSSKSNPRIYPLRDHRRQNPLLVEQNLSANNNKDIIVIGSDDCGAGCIAGPIVAVSCFVDNDALLIDGVDDCKRISEDDRLRIYQKVLSRPLLYHWTVATRTPQQIDEHSVSKMVQDAFQESINVLTNKLKLIYPGKCYYSIVDGHASPRVDIPSRPWIRGDEMVYSVALASILARVIRDSRMNEVSKVYPEYGFDKHAGYPTRDHIAALHQHGPSPLHRASCKPLRGRYDRFSLSRKDTVANLAITAALLVTFPKDTRAVTTDPKTGIALPDVGEIEAAAPSDWSSMENPFQEKSLFNRLDSSSDAKFYESPRFVEHVDAQAVQLLTNYVSEVAIQPSTQSVLDLCSSWTSHIVVDRNLPRVAGLGMNDKELQANKVLTEWIVQDLNENPVLPYQDNSFDVVLCQLSIDYLAKPLQVSREIGRVLKPGGTVHILFSNRLFLSKAVALWTGADDIDHTFTVASYLHYCDGGLDNIRAVDLSRRNNNKNQRIVGDPLYVVTATKA